MVPFSERDPGDTSDPCIFQRLGRVFPATTSPRSAALTLAVLWFLHCRAHIFKPYTSIRRLLRYPDGSLPCRRRCDGFFKEATAFVQAVCLLHARLPNLYGIFLD